MDCDYCGLRWYRSECYRDPTGWLNCPDCQTEEGKDLMTMERERSAAAAELASRPPPSDDGR